MIGDPPNPVKQAVKHQPQSGWLGEGLRKGPVGHACLTGDGSSLVFELDAKRLQILDLNNSGMGRTIADHQGLAYFSVSSNGKWIATGTWHGTGVRI